MSSPRIDSYSFGRIIIDGQTHTADVIILPERVIGNWWRSEGHRLHSVDLGAVFEVAPAVLVVGEGAYGRMRVAHETRQALQAAGIELINLQTREACERYNELREERPVAAALHLTC